MNSPLSEPASSTMPNPPTNSSDTDWRTLYPFCSHHHALGNDGEHRMHYVDEGPGSASPGAPTTEDREVESLLMVHGNPTWSFYWRNLIAAWSERYRTVAPDHLGMGLSDKPQEYPYSLTQHADNLVSLIDALDLKNITLLAHDWGGAIGLQAALLRPERFRKFVLFNTGAFPPPYVPKRIAVCRLPIVGNWAMRSLNAFAQSAQSMATNFPGGLPKPVLKGLIAPYDSWQNRVGIANFVGDIPLRTSHPTHQVLVDLENGLEQFADRPVKLVWGMKDWCFTPKCLRRFEGIFPDAESHPIQNAGHWVIEDSVEEVIEVVGDFLQRYAMNPVASR